MANKNKKISMAGPLITKEDEKFVLDAFRNSWYGDKIYYYVEKFEDDFAKFHNRKFALMTPNCTTAIHLLLAGLDIKENDEVIAPECTWVGSVAGIKYQRAKIVLADIDNKNWCLTKESIERVITKNTKAVIVVNLYGNMPDYEQITKLCEDRNIFLIEDAAESLGSTYFNIKSGKFGIGSVFSFQRTKTITTGEGGMLLLDNKDLFERCKFLRDHGRKSGSFFNTEITFKYMPFNIQAALGYAQFLRIDEIVEKKRWILKGFKSRLSDIPDIYLNPEPNHVVNGAWSPALVFGKSHKMTRDIALKEMPKFNLPIRPFFYPLSYLPAFNQEKEGRKNNPTAYDVSSRGINLPCALNLDDDDLDIYCDALYRMLGIRN